MNWKFNIDPITMFMVSLICVGIALIWYINLPLIVQIIVTIILIVSMYYQIMTSTMGLSPSTMVMNIEDRIMNEVAYQVIKRGYYIRFEIKEKTMPEDLKKPSARWLKYTLKSKINFSVEDNVYISVVKCNVPKGLRKWIKFVSFINVVSRPAWWYREFDEEDDVMYNEDKDKNLINTVVRT